MKNQLWIAIFLVTIFNEVQFIFGEEQKSERFSNEDLADVDSDDTLQLKSNQTNVQYQGKDPKQATPNPVAVVAISAVAAATQKLVGAVQGALQSINRLNTNFHLNAEAARLAPTTPTTSTTPKPTTPTTPSTTSNSSEITDYDEDGNVGVFV